jgi:hypothetical protein
MAANGLTGIARLSGLVDPNAEATPEELHGYPVDPRHAQPGEPTLPGFEYRKPGLSRLVSPGAATAPPRAVPEFGLTGDDEWSDYVLPGGTQEENPNFDLVGETRAAPWPKGYLNTTDPNQSVMNIERSAEIHASNRGAGNWMTYVPQLYPNEDSWEEIWEVNPGQSELVDVPNQLKGIAIGGFGQRDRTQSFARQNEYGFDSKHQHRRYATGHIPGNYMWLKPTGRPLIKSLPGPARPPIGVDSPFEGQDLGLAFAYDNGAVLQNAPSEYVAPPAPNLAAPVVSQDSVPTVDFW